MALSRRIIFGPPGTGKTSYLLTLIRQIDDYENILFSSFTKKSVREMTERIKSSLG
jgi:replication-associated recombination protein RarA